LKKILLVLFSLMISHHSLPQEIPDTREDPLYVGVKVHYGFIIPHYVELKEISQKKIWGFQIDFSRLFTSKKAWSSCNCYSRVGLSLNYFDYRNPDILGHSYNLMLFTEPYFNFNSRFRISIRGGMGLTYLDEVYDEVSNPKNLYYSSIISGILSLALNFNYLVKENYQFNLGVNYNHISNGGMKMPNKGMNFPTISLGLDYIFRPQTLYGKEKYPGLKSKPLHYYSRLYWSFRTVEGDENYDQITKLMAGVEGGIIKGISNINGLLFGIEISYDGSNREWSERLARNYSPFIISLHAGHVFVVGRFSFTQQMAWYVFHESPSQNKSFFQRYGIFYNFGKLVSLGFSMKAHGHVAEQMDIRMGVAF
jgi:hypothetical protein